MRSYIKSAPLLLWLIFFSLSPVGTDRLSALLINEAYAAFPEEEKQAPEKCTLPYVATAEELEEKLFAVHATKYFPTDGIVQPGGDPRNKFRPTLHFALGALVARHRFGQWEDSKYAIVTPLKSLVPQLVNLNPHDTFILGAFKLDEQTTLIVPEGEDTSSIPPGVMIHTYPPKLPIRKVIDQVIQQRGGCFADHGYETAMVGEIDIADPAYFEPLLAKYDALQISYGDHVKSLRGDAHYFGLIDHHLSEISKSIDANKFKSADRGVLEWIKFFARKLDALVAGRPYPDGAKQIFKKEFLKLQERIAKFDGILPAASHQDIWNLQGASPTTEVGPADVEEFFNQYRPAFDKDDIEYLVEEAKISAIYREIKLDQKYLIRRGSAGQETILERFIANFLKAETKFQLSIVDRLISHLKRSSINELALLNALVKNDAVRELLSAKHYLFALNPPFSFGDILHADPKTKVAFDPALREKQRQEQLEKIPLEAREDALRILNVWEPEESAAVHRPGPIDSYSSALGAAREGHLSASAIELMEEASTRQLASTKSDRYEGGKLSKYELIRLFSTDNDYEKLAKYWGSRFGLEAAFRAKFKTNEEFWNSQQTFVQVFQELSRL